MDLSALTSLYGHVPALMLVMARVGSLFLSAPVVGGPWVPNMPKALLSLAVSFILYPSVTQTGPVPVDFGFVLLLAREAMVGVSLGFLLNLFFHGVRLGGELINRHAGFSASENFDPESDVGAGPMGDMMHFLMVMLFLATDGHHHLFASLSRSFDFIPLGGWILTPAFPALLAKGVSEMWLIGLVLSFPVLTAIMLLTMAEGVITRAIPQINVMHISFTVKILTSLAVLYAGLPTAVAFLGTVLGAMRTVGEAFIAG